MKKLLLSATLGLCLSVPFAKAGKEFTVQNATTVSTEAIDYVIETTMLNLKSSLTTQNTPWLVGSALIGFLGFDMMRKSIHTMVDKSLGLKKNENVTYKKLVAKTVIGASLIGAAGWGIQTILK
jgi:hypothetical protein